MGDMVSWQNGLPPQAAHGEMETLVPEHSQITGRDYDSQNAQIRSKQIHVDAHLELTIESKNEGRV